MSRNEQTLTVTRGADLAFDVYLVHGDHVLSEAIEVSHGSEHHQQMSECDARFEIVISDLNAALSEMNTLMELQGALQDASKGYLFTPWNGNILEPWLEE